MKELKEKETIKILLKYCGCLDRFEEIYEYNKSLYGDETLIKVFRIFQKLGLKPLGNLLTVDSLIKKEYHRPCLILWNMTTLAILEKVESKGGDNLFFVNEGSEGIKIYHSNVFLEKWGYVRYNNEVKGFILIVVE